jgi:hypothetical protein
MGKSSQPFFSIPMVSTANVEACSLIGMRAKLLLRQKEKRLLESKGLSTFDIAKSTQPRNKHRDLLFASKHNSVRWRHRP